MPNCMYHLLAVVVTANGKRHADLFLEQATSHRLCAHPSHTRLSRVSLKLENNLTYSFDPSAMSHKLMNSP
jgi:hypothetical protein